MAELHRNGSRALLAERAYLLLCQEGVSACALALRLNVSPATAARIVASLRRKGVRLASVREGRGWHYEIRQREEAARRRWLRSSLRRMAGFVRSWRRMAGRDEDGVIYGDA